MRHPGTFKEAVSERNQGCARQRETKRLHLDTLLDLIEP
jgi:hypothetical protein